MRDMPLKILFQVSHKMQKPNCILQTRQIQLLIFPELRTQSAADAAAACSTNQPVNPLSMKRTSFPSVRTFKLILFALLPVLGLGGCDRVYEEIQTTVYIRVDRPLKAYSSEYVNGTFVQTGQILSFSLRNTGDWWYGGSYFALNENVYRDLDIKYLLQLQDYSDYSVFNAAVDVVYNGDTVHHAVYPLRDSANVWDNPARATGTFRIR